MVEVVGNGPVEIFYNGRQWSIPLSLLYFSGSIVKADHWTPYTTSTNPPLPPIVDRWLTCLVAQGVLTQAPQAPLSPAFVLQAVDAGAMGNGIVVTFNSYPAQNPPPVTFDQTVANLTVVATEVYAGLTLTSVQSVLGTGAGKGSTPGLVFVASMASATPGLPTALPTNAPLGLNATTKNYEYLVSGAFTLQAKNNSADAGLTKISIALDPGGATFTLTVSWTKTTTATLASLAQAGTSPFGYLINLVPLRDGITVAPTPGKTVTLVGGADPAGGSPGAAAQFTVLGA